MSLPVEVLPGVLASGLAAGVLFLAGTLVPHEPTAVGARLAPAVAVAMAFSLGFLLVHRHWPSFPLAPSTSAFEWVAWFAVGGLAFGAAEVVGPLPPAFRFGLRFTAALAASWLILAPHAVMAPATRWTATLVAAAGTTLLWTVAAARRGDGPLLPLLPVAIAAGVAAVCFAMTSGSIALGLTTANLAVALLVVSLLAVATGRRPGFDAAAAVAAPVFGTLVLAAWAYLNYEDRTFLPTPSALLFLLAPAAGITAEARRLPRGDRASATLLGAGVTLLFVALAWWIAGRHAPPPLP